MALDQEQVVKTALDLLDEVGLEGLSLRKLAGKLGVQAPALYWHFKSKQDLLDQMAEALMVTERPPLRRLRPDEDWGAWLADHARVTRSVLLSRRDAALLVSSTHPRGMLWEQIEAMLEDLTSAGFSLTDAMYGLFAVGNFVAGFALEESIEKRAEARGEGGSPEELAAEFDRMAIDYPLTVQAIRAVGDPQGDETFERGLALIISGVRAGWER